jgi:hypothetical protein
MQQQQESRPLYIIALKYPDLSKGSPHRQHEEFPCVIMGLGLWGSGCKVKPGGPGGTILEDLQEVMMSVAQQTAIKAFQHLGFGPSAIAARLGVDRKTVRQDLAPDDFSPQPPPQRPCGSSTRKPYPGVIPQELAEDVRTFHRSHHTAPRILERLQAEYPACVGWSALVQRDRDQAADARTDHRHPGAGWASLGLSGGLRHRCSGSGRRPKDLDGSVRQYLQIVDSGGSPGAPGNASSPPWAVWTTWPPGGWTASCRAWRSLPALAGPRGALSHSGRRRAGLGPVLVARAAWVGLA